LNRQLNDNIANLIEYVPDDIFCDRLTEDLKLPNIFDPDHTINKTFNNYKI
jgi:hypothetical protein